MSGRSTTSFGSITARRSPNRGVESSRTLPATIEAPTIEDIWNAASLKGRFPIAYADAFAAALAQKYNCPLVTGDPELRVVDQLELVWIGGGNTLTPRR
jgi:predicted nucleic acid-binding protein